MARANVINKNEVLLGDTYFPIIGPVRVTNITVTPNPVIFGDTQQQGDTQVMSQLIQASVTGGSGIYKGNPRTDAERSWKSRAETRYRGFICLPPFAFDMGKPTGLTSEPITMSVDYRNSQFFAFANKVYQWLNATAAWSALDRTLTSNPTDIGNGGGLVFQDKLYIACGTALEVRDNAGVWTVQAIPASFLTVWDNKIWRLGVSGVTWTLYHSTNGTAWTSAASLQNDVVPQQLLVYRDVGGSSIIYVMTETGPWVYDAANTRFLQSDVRIPRVESGHACLGIVFRDAKLYFLSGGLGMVSVQAGNPFIASPEGLDTDDGVPSEDAGTFVAIAADFNWLLAIVDSSSGADDDEDWVAMAGPFEGWDWSLQEGLSTLRAWQGGWHVLWESPTLGAPGRIIAVSSAYGERRIYWGQGGSAYYMDVSTQVHNPRHNPVQQFAAGPVTHITPWWAYGSEVQEKIHGHFYVGTKGCSATERVTIYYGTELDDNNWIQLGTITDDGIHVFKPGNQEGVQARFFRFRLDLERGSDKTKTPFVEYWSSEFMRLLPATYAFAAEIDLTREHRGKQPAELLALIRQITDPDRTPKMIRFAYRDEFGAEPQTYWGRISRLSGQEYTSRDQRGQSNYMVSFIAPYSDDTE